MLKENLFHFQHGAQSEGLDLPVRCMSLCEEVKEIIIVAITEKGHTFQTKISCKFDKLHTN